MLHQVSDVSGGCSVELLRTEETENLLIIQNILIVTTAGELIKREQYNSMPLHVIHTHYKFSS